MSPDRVGTLEQEETQRATACIADARRPASSSRRCDAASDGSDEQIGQRPVGEHRGDATVASLREEELPLVARASVGSGESDLAVGSRVPPLEPLESREDLLDPADAEAPVVVRVGVVALHPGMRGVEDSAGPQELRDVPRGGERILDVLQERRDVGEAEVPHETGMLRREVRIAEVRDPVDVDTLLDVEPDELAARAEVRPESPSALFVTVMVLRAEMADGPGHTVAAQHAREPDVDRLDLPGDRELPEESGQRRRGVFDTDPRRVVLARLHAGLAALLSAPEGHREQGADRRWLAQSPGAAA